MSPGSTLFIHTCNLNAYLCLVYIKLIVLNYWNIPKLSSMALYLFYLCMEHSCLHCVPLLCKTALIPSGMAVCSACTWYMQCITDICNKIFSKSEVIQGKVLSTSSPQGLTWCLAHNHSPAPNRLIGKGIPVHDKSIMILVLPFILPSGIILFIVVQVELLFLVPLMCGIPDLLIPTPQVFSCKPISQVSFTLDYVIILYNSKHKLESSTLILFNHAYLVLWV